MASFGFTASDYKPDEGFQPVPPGEYPAIITQADIKPNSMNTGAYMNVKFVIADGEYANRVVFNNYNISHPNPKAVEIGRSQLSALCLAIGFPDANDSDLLLQKSCMITVGIKNDAQRGPQNEIKGYAPLVQQGMPQQAQQPVQQAQQPQQQQTIAAHTPPFNQPGQQPSW